MKEKQPAPTTDDAWKAYYIALKNKNVKDKFHGECDRLGNIWDSIAGYHGIDADQDCKKYHPWFVPKMKDWDKTLRKDGEVKSKEIKDSYNHRVGQELINKGMKDKNRDLLTPHHLISVCVTKAIHSRWKNIIESEIGYNVNCAQNLLVLPNIADVACHLGIPLHHHNHIDGASITQEEYDGFARLQGTRDKKTDNLWSKTVTNKVGRTMGVKGYHSKVYKLMTPVLLNHFKKCKDIDDIQFIRDMNGLSKRILGRIKAFDMTLNQYGSDYKLGKEAGCRNARGTSGVMPAKHPKSESNKDLSKKCSLKRNHAYLDILFTTPYISNEMRKKAGFVVASKLKYK